MVSAFVPGASGPGSGPSWGHCVVFLGKIQLSQCLSPPRSIKWVLVNCWGNLTNCGKVTCDGLASHPRGVEILLAASCYGNRDKLRQQEPVLASRLHSLIISHNMIMSTLDRNS